MKIQNLYFGVMKNKTYIIDYKTKKECTSIVAIQVFVATGIGFMEVIECKVILQI